MPATYMELKQLKHPSQQKSVTCWKRLCFAMFPCTTKPRSPGLPLYHHALHQVQRREVKSSLVAGGHHPDDQIDARMSSPAVDTNRFLCLATYAWEHLLKTATLDVGCAYLNSSREGHHQIFMNISAKQVEKVLVKLDGEGTCQTRSKFQNMRGP